MYLPVGGGVVAVVGQEVVNELPEDVTGNAAIWSTNVVVGLLQHVLKIVQGQVFTQHFVCQTINIQQSVQLLEKQNTVRKFF